MFKVRKFSLITIIFLNIFQISYCNNNKNYLVKAFHHIGVNQDKIIFYFQDKVIPKKINNQKDSIVFEFKNCEVQNSEDTNRMVAKLNRYKHPFYSIYLIQKPNNIILFKIDFKPEFVKKILPSSFNAISLYNGIMFNILHVNIKDHIKNPVLPHGKILNINNPNIVIDMGHGGHDTGAVGQNNIQEKNVTYKVGSKLKRIFEKRGKYNIFCTRTSDKFVDLDRRTSMSNLLPPKTIFVSIHANHSNNCAACGLETHYAESSLLNHFDNKNKIDSQFINFKNLDQNNKLLADIVHNSLLANLKLDNINLIDRKVKKSVSQVLIGTQMPSILIELGFLSNKQECNFLNNDQYQNNCAKAIADGVDKYFEAIHSF